MKVKIRFSFEYENAINVSEKISKFIEEEIYKTLDDLKERK